MKKSFRKAVIAVGILTFPLASFAANSKLARVEQIKKFILVEGDWLPGGDELTPTMKLKRKPIAGKYAEQIEAMYT